MKVLFYFGIFAKIGGIEEFTHDLALALHYEGVEVEVLCASLENTVLNNLVKEGVKVSKIPVYYGCRWNIPDYALLPYALMKMQQADVVIHQKPFPKNWYPLYSHHAKHVYITAYRPLEQFPDKEERNNFFSFFDLILTQSEEFVSDFDTKNFPVRYQVVPLIPPATSCLQVAQRDDHVLRIGMLGRVEPQKNPTHALQIVALLKKKLALDYAAIELHVYGAGSLLSEMKELAKKLGVNSVFHGIYARSAVPDIVAENDLFLITSVSEGQCIAALEILAGGRPLFATPVGALPEILADARRGALIPLDDNERAARNICAWLARNLEWKAENIQESYLNDFDRKNITKQYVKLLTRIGLST